MSVCPNQNFPPRVPQMQRGNKGKSQEDLSASTGKDCKNCERPALDKGGCNINKLKEFAPIV